MQRFTSLPRLKLFKWTRTGGSTTEAENAAWNALHSGMREITLTAADLAGDVRITCTVTGTAGVYGTVQVDAATMIASHTRGESDAGHTFRIEKGDLLLAVPEVEEAPLESDPETDPTEEIEPLPADDGELAEPTDAEGDAAVPDIAEPAEESDLGEGTYIAGEEEAEGYEDPVNDTPDAEYVDVDTLPDEDAVKKPRGIDYVLEDGLLRVNTGLSGDLSSWATVYATEPDKLVEFSYNHNGLRTRKKVTTKTVVDSAEQTTVETTDYTLHGKLITHLTKGTVVDNGTATTEEMHFYYDAQSRPAMVEFRSKLYTYLHNLQGDVIAIVDSEGNRVVEYDYDAWGRPTRAWSDDNSGLESSLITEYAKLCELNPFRYRGYVWDSETGMYYLRSRYYNPVWGRFVNADIAIGSICGLFSHNQYCYCFNIPNSLIDMEGKAPQRLKNTNIHSYRRHMIPSDIKLSTRIKLRKKATVLKPENEICIRRTESFEDVVYIIESMVFIPDANIDRYFRDLYIKELYDSNSESLVLGLILETNRFSVVSDVVGTIGSAIERRNYAMDLEGAIDSSNNNQSGMVLIQYREYRVNQLGTFGGVSLRTAQEWETGFGILDQTVGSEWNGEKE